MNKTSLITLTISFFAAACSMEAGMESDELSALADAPAEGVGETSAALRLAGVPLDSATTPWTRRPTVFSQVSYAAVGADFNPQQDTIEAIDPDYFPSLLASAQKSGSAARYVGAWHKDQRIGSWQWDRNIADADFGARWQERLDAGFEFFDFNVHVDNGAAFYDGIWVKREGQRSFASNRNMTLAQLQAHVTERKADGYRLKRLSEYKLGNNTRYIGLWTKDGLTDFRWTHNKSATALLDMHDQNAADGYVITDISPHNVGGSVVYSGIWLKNSEVRSDAYDSNMTEDDFRTKNADYVAGNHVLVDLNAFYDTGGNLRYAAVWHRTERKDTLESNAALPANDTANLRTAIDSFENDATNVGSEGRFGLFVQNLSSGSWVGYNMNEPFYMASTTKFLLGAKVIDDTNSAWDPTSLRNTDWRGEDDRGFTLAQFNGGNQTLDTFLGNMLNHSDSASTDRLWGLVQAGSAGALRNYLKSNLGLQNIGEITTICELDKRVQLVNDPCVRNVSCDTFEAWLRDDDDNYNATAAEKACLANLDGGPDDGEFEPYYATLANSITPVEYGHAVRELSGSEMSTAERARFLEITDETSDSGFDPDQGTLYDKVSTKGGDKRKAKAQVGVMFDWAGAANDYTRVTPRYSFVVFAEKYSNSSHNPEPAMRSAVQHAIRFLQNR